MRTVARAAAIAAVLSVLCAGCPRGGGGLAVEETRERIAPLLGVQPGTILGNGPPPPRGIVGDRIWTLADPVPTREGTTFTTCRGRIAFYGTPPIKGHYLRLPSWTRGGDSRISVADAQAQARELATLYWMQGAPPGAKLTVTRAEPIAYGSGSYVVGVGLTDAGPCAPREATFYIDVHGRGCSLLYTKDWP